MNIKALSIRQPWAYAITMGFKDIENRTWWTPFRGPVMIHAGKREEKNDVDLVLARMAPRLPQAWGATTHEKLARLRADYEETKGLGCFVGGGVVVDCVQQHPSEWFEGPYGFVIEQAFAAMIPTPCKGKLGFFDVPSDTVRLWKQVKLLELWEGT